MPDETINSMLREQRKFPPAADVMQSAYINSPELYNQIYRRSIDDPQGFWAEIASSLHWFKKWDSVFHYTEKPFAKWFEGGKINVAYNCLDRHLSTSKKNKAALIWEGESGESYTYTYQELYRQVCRFSNVLKKHSLIKGDRVCLYMPMIPQLAIAMLACARIGVIHSIVFGGFSADAIKSRIQDCESKVVITADGGYRNGKTIPLKQNVDEALKECPTVQKVIVVQRAHNPVDMKPERDYWWHDEISKEDIKNDCPAEWMDAEDSLFILYTSGTTGKPKGVLHTTGGYLIYVYLTAKWIFDMKDDDTYWCTADIGWITGHSYIVYGPLVNGATSVMFEGIPTYPKPDRFWEIIEKYSVNTFYTAPTALRSLEKFGNEWPNKHDLSSLRLLGSVGEPINPEAWMWYYTVIGKSRCPIVDTWWQTETGGILISPLPGATTLKPGSATKPFFGIDAAVYKENGEEAGTNEGGYLVIKKPWPGMARTIWGNPDKYKQTYFGKFPDVFFSGDSARKDEDGYYWIMGRIDDVIKVSGHRLGTAEIESALVSHPMVAEAAIVAFPHEIKGQALYAFVSLKHGVARTEQLKQDLREHVAKVIGPIAKPDKIQFADELPKTRSGKIMRRILKAIACGEEDLGNTTTLSDPSVVETLKKERQ
jgi:acetyl-CoA synthetase